MNNREKSVAKLEPCSPIKSTPLSPLPTPVPSWRSDSQRRRNNDSSSGSNDAHRAELVLKSVDPALASQILYTDKPINKPVEEYSIKRNESTQRVDVPGNLASSQLLTSAVPPASRDRLASGKGKHDNWFNRAAVVSDQVDLSTNSQCISAVQSVVQRTPETSSPIVSCSPTRHFDNGAAQIILDCNNENIQTKSFMQETKKTIEAAAAAVHGRSNETGVIGPTKAENHERPSSILTEANEVGDDAAIRRRFYARLLAKQGFEVVSHPSHRHRGRNQSQVVKTEVKLSHNTEESFENPLDDEQASRVATSRTPAELQNPTGTPSFQKVKDSRHFERPARAERSIDVVSEQHRPSTAQSSVSTPTNQLREATDCHSAEHLPCEEQPPAHLAAPTNLDPTLEKLVESRTRSLVTEHVIQVLIPAAKPSHVSKQPMLRRDITADELRQAFDEQNNKSKDHSGKSLKQRPSRNSAFSAVKERPAVPKSNMPIDHPSPRNVLSYRAPSDDEDPLGLEIPVSQSSSKDTPTSKSSRSQTMTVTKSPYSVSRPSERGRSSSPRSPKKQGKSRLKATVADSFSSISEAVLECSEDELSFM